MLLQRYNATLVQSRYNLLKRTTMFTYIFLAVLAVSTIVQLWLARRQTQHVNAHQTAVPTAFAEKITLEEHQEAAQYTLTKNYFGQFMLIIEVGILLLWTLGGLLNWLDHSWQGMEWSTLWTGVAVIVSMMMISSLVDLPSSIYSTFHIEAKFGFNRTTPRLFAMDLLKSFALSFAIGIPLIALVLWLMESMGSLWWIYVWAVLMAFNLLMLWAYPTFIAPWFNEFKSLEDETLKQRIEQLLSRSGFKSQGIFVMDGSKRSGHGNAYFTGLGNNKQIIFFDTLLKSLDHDEIEAVLAHEVGHFKHKHITKRLIMMSLLSLGGLALLGWLMQNTWFYQGLGIETPSTYTALILFTLVMPAFTFFLYPIIAWFSRKHEFEADNFAAEQSKPNFLIQALVKLYKENASTLTPDPLYSAFYDSHPPAPVRIAHLSAKLSK